MATIRRITNEEKVIIRAPTVAPLGASETLKAVTPSTVVSSTEITHPRLRAIPRKAKRAAFIVPAITTLLCLVLFDERLNISPQCVDIALWIMIGGAAFTFLSGALLRCKRLGALTGFLIGIGVILAVHLTYPETLTLKEIIREFSDWTVMRYVVAFTLGGAGLGVTGAALRQVCLRAVLAAALAVDRQRDNVDKSGASAAAADFLRRGR